MAIERSGTKSKPLTVSPIMSATSSRVILPVIIRGTGAYAPDSVLTNDHFAGYLDTSDDWITQRTGIKERRRAAENQTTASLAVEAARRAIENAGLTPPEIDLLVVCTATPDLPLPSTACIVQNELGLRHVPAFDLSAACSGLMYGLVVAGNMITSGPYRHALVIGSEVLTRFCDYEDRTTCVLFGDGAGAVILEPSDDPNRGFLYTNLGADGSMWQTLWVPAGGTREPASIRTVNEKLHFVRMRGRELYKVAVTKMQDLIDQALKETGLTPDDLAMVLPHQSNLRIIESFSSKLKLPPEKVAINITEYGNTSAASIGLALDDARRNGRLKTNDLVLMVAFGAGVTWGTIVARL